ncbi:iron-hydroxamate ABC transporter substrate-binding protein [Paenibacillus herberti]|uniref:Iron(3+)-hydroxamate-binding protein fhuD n=1 Tax=Paenibacillus herberti TaxID=1619309 RepID=A0A229NVB4_9BACL|nr:iron-hydroxamate ABC transporter substrate-binding protein [Paenibacillus herberti]OXM13675.1 iron(3+)-hydroxamate-binding protein fhuD [Paenibacillus herberti]
MKFVSNRFSRLTLLSIPLTLSLLLAACSQSSSSSPSPSPSASPAASAEPSTSPAGTGETMVFKAANGDITVPKNPQRIVDLTGSFTGHFLALGIKPVGILDQAFKNPFFEGLLEGVGNVGSGGEVEKIIALDPDLIIMFSGGEGLEKLEKIAPTVAVQYGLKTYKEQLKEFGVLTGQEKKAQEWIDQWDAKIAEAKPQVVEAVGDRTVSILNPFAKGLYVFGHNFGRSGEIIYGEFGLKAPAIAQKEAIDSGTGWAEISLEKLPEYAGDIIFTSPWSGDDADPKVVYDNTLWKSLPAVKEGRVFQLNADGAYFNDPISLDKQFEFVKESLLSLKK